MRLNYLFLAEMILWIVQTVIDGVLSYCTLYSNTEGQMGINSMNKSFRRFDFCRPIACLDVFQNSFKFTFSLEKISSRLSK